MARPRTFDEERALDAAMRTFWAKGYDATSTEDLCTATGLGRSSIYNTFVSKRELFRRALARYIESTTADQDALLEDTEVPALDRIRALLSRVLEGELEGRRNGRSMGCLTVNTTVELGDREPEFARLLERDTEHRLAVLRVVIRSGQRAGDITSTREPAALARYLNAVIAGIRVAGQGGADRAELEAIAATALDVFTG